MLDEHGRGFREAIQIPQIHHSVHKHLDVGRGIIHAEQLIEALRGVESFGGVLRCLRAHVALRSRQQTARKSSWAADSCYDNAGDLKTHAPCRLMFVFGHRNSLRFTLALSLWRCRSCTQRESASATVRLVHANVVSNRRAANSCSLSTRERAVLGWVGDGNTSWEMGQVLGNAESAMAVHFKATKVKLGVPNRVQAFSQG
jgi:ATP/maltotriose-dependent transcriptional regulator MalT